MRLQSRALSLALSSSLLFPPGCALFGGTAGGAQSAAAWKRDAKAQVAADKPAQEDDVRTFVVQQTDAIAERADEVIASTGTLAKILLGQAPAFKGATPTSFVAHTATLRTVMQVPKLLPFDERTLKRWFVPPTAAESAALAKLAGKPAQIEKIRTALDGVQGSGYHILLEQNRAVALDWGAELRALVLGAEVVAFEKRYETKASKETLDAVAQLLALRAQARALLMSNTALLAAYEGVSQGGDPEAIGALAQAITEQLAQPRDASSFDPRAFLDGLGTEGLDIAASLESNMRAAQGDANYEKVYQRELVQTLQEIEEAEQQVAIADVIDQQARAVALAQAKTLRDTAQQRLVERAKAMGMAKGQQLLAAMPYGAQLTQGLAALRELRAGNPRGALMAAADAAPPGAIGQGIKTALKLAFAVGDMIKKRRR